MRGSNAYPSPINIINITIIIIIIIIIAMCTSLSQEFIPWNYSVILKVLISTDKNLVPAVLIYIIYIYMYVKNNGKPNSFIAITDIRLWFTYNRKG